MSSETETFRETSMPRLNEPAPAFEAKTIDDKGILRAMVYYPMSNGRSVPEFLRLVSAMQTSDENKVATPEGWQPGDKVIVPPPATVEDAEKRMHEGLECVDWFFCKKAL